MNSKANFACADNYLIDVQFGIIVDVEASRAIRQAEVGASRTMIARTEKGLGSGRSGWQPTPLTAPTKTCTGSLICLCERLEHAAIRAWGQSRRAFE